MDSNTYPPSTCLWCGEQIYQGILHFCEKMKEGTNWSGSYSYTSLPILTATGDRIGLEPFPPEEQKPKAVGKGFVVAAQKNELKGLRVLIGNEKYPNGSLAFVSAEGYAHDWAKTVYTVDGVSFILVPSNQIIFTKVG